MRRTLPTLSLLLLTIISTGAAFGQEREGKMLDPTQVPLEAARLEDFAPRGWKIHSQARDDLNGDGRIDAALILFDSSLDEATPRSIENPPPALVIVLATEQGRWRRAGINNRMIVADDSGFAPLRLRILKGVVVLDQEEQSNISDNTNDYSYTYRFRYEPAADRFLLIGEDDANTHRDAAADGIRVSDDYLTGKRVITIMHAARGKYVRETNTTRRIEAQRVFLEEAKIRTSTSTNFLRRSATPENPLPGALRGERPDGPTAWNGVSTGSDSNPISPRSGRLWIILQDQFVLLSLPRGLQQNHFHRTREAKWQTHHSRNAHDCD